MFLIPSNSLPLVSKVTTVSQAFMIYWELRLQITMNWLKASKTIRSWAISLKSSRISVKTSILYEVLGKESRFLLRLMKS